MMTPADRAATTIQALGQLLDSWTPVPEVAEVVARIARVDLEVAEDAVTGWAYLAGLDARQSVGEDLRPVLLIRFPTERTTP